jgi:hypothetical protein
MSIKPLLSTGQNSAGGPGAHAADSVLIGHVDLDLPIEVVSS